MNIICIRILSSNINLPLSTFCKKNFLGISRESSSSIQAKRNLPIFVQLEQQRGHEITLEGPFRRKTSVYTIPWISFHHVLFGWC